MASQIKRPLVLGNFRPLARKPRKKSTWRERRQGMSADHIACIRKLPCCVCLKQGPSEAHHLKAGTGERGMSVRSTDRHTVPVCRVHHDAVERIGTRNEVAWFREHGGFDCAELAATLWSNTGDVSAMLKVLMVHRGTAP